MADSWPKGLLLIWRGCVEHDRERLDVICRHVSIHEKALPVFRDVVCEGIGGGDLRASMNLEERNGSSSGEARLRVDRHRGQYPSWPLVKYFLSVFAPAGLRAAAAG